MSGQNERFNVNVAARSALAGPEPDVHRPTLGVHPLTPDVHRLTVPDLPPPHRPSIVRV